MYKDYSVEEKINFLKKIQKDMRFKQDVLTKSLSDDFIFLEDSQAEGGVDHLLGQINEDNIKELLGCEEGEQLIDTMIGKSIGLAQLNNKNIAISLMAAQTDLITTAISEFFTNTKFQNEVSAIIAAMVSQSFIKGISTATNLITQNDAQKTTEDAIKELLHAEDFKKSQNELLRILISVSQNSVVDVFPSIMENIVSNIKTPD